MGPVMNALFHSGPQFQNGFRDKYGGKVLSKLLHRCANSIKLFVSLAVRALAMTFSTNFSTQLLKSF
jgi:hypothetical protein